MTRRNIRGGTTGKSNHKGSPKKTERTRPHTDRRGVTIT